MIITKYKNPVLFYSIATLIPWAFWFTAGYISHLTPHSDQNLRIASILGFIGLLGPMGVTYWFASRDSALRYDILGRICNFSSFPPIYLILSFILMPASILLAQAVSLLFGYSASQFVITGHFTFSSGIFPVWFMLIMAPVIEELAWHSYGTDCLRNQIKLM